MHLTISVTVIMFELTGALTYILPTMVCPCAEYRF
jgi:chloride channel 3/4/5